MGLPAARLGVEPPTTAPSLKRRCRGDVRIAGGKLAPPPPAAACVACVAAPLPAPAATCGEEPLRVLGEPPAAWTLRPVLASGVPCGSPAPRNHALLLPLPLVLLNAVGADDASTEGVAAGELSELCACRLQAHSTA
jgi:hypothetical protein